MREVSFYELFSWPDRMLQSVQLITCCRAKPDSYLDGDDRLGGDLCVTGPFDSCDRKYIFCWAFFGNTVHVSFSPSSPER